MICPACGAPFPNGGHTRTKVGGVWMWGCPSVKRGEIEVHKAVVPTCRVCVAVENGLCRATGDEECPFGCSPER